MFAIIKDFHHAAGITYKQLSGVCTWLDRFLRDLVEPMCRRERHHWAQVCSQGLLLDGGRKSVHAIAERIARAYEQMLNQFLNQSRCEVNEIERYLARELSAKGVDLVYWVIAETSFAKVGEHSVGLARQYCGTLETIANCQVAVSLLVESEAGFLFPEQRTGSL